MLQRTRITINCASATATYRADIDGLRAIAVASVLVFHAFPNVLPGGFVGVDVFFVISGYLITQLMIDGLENGEFRFFRFYIRRVARLFPALLITLAACYGFGWFNLLDYEFKALGKHIASGALSIANWVYWKESGYFDVDSIQKPLLHLWSLGVEEQFYLFWPMVLWLLFRFRKNALLAIVGIGIASFVANVILTEHRQASAFFLPMPRAWELMLGAAVAFMHSKNICFAREYADCKAAFGMLLIAAACVMLNEKSSFPGWWALLPTFGAAITIDARHSRINGRLLSHPWFVGIGLISYPLYLYHWPLLSSLQVVSIDTPAWQLRAAALLCCFPLAWGTYRFIERPLRRNSRPALTATLLAVSMAGVGYIGFNTYDRDGLNFRMSRLVTQFTDDVHFDLDREWRRHTCYIADEETAFAPECADSGGTGPLMMLWGDSHSAAVYPALRDSHRAFGMRLAQYSVASCPPVLLRGPCDSVEAGILSVVRAIKPDVIVLTANWTKDSLDSLRQTVDAIRESGVNRIVLLGPVPKWTAMLPKVYWAYWRKHREKLPEYTAFGLDTSVAELDRYARGTASSLGIEYASAYQALCNDKGCRTRYGSGKGKPIMYDDHHLTPAGATALMDKLAPSLFAREPARR
ncbi:acyltransferase family protein [Burkholderia thailandensis]|uniref:Acyltransferase family protein n=1 Tax=Burkholderia thailandensis (strain ATCC 700388 / DSM 13276 / CCUG 48851 / CIP 106301 / E264) TaxID=271848 RepID=Q2SXG1_BURTA|nr:acyltransferase family protein [Burkholderia thailandensis]ABC38515.1 acyltransferase family protein [Burkholderia thailandensis E264]NBC91563.1 acyltransferase family protein [Burkholderia thailandensis]PHH37657.1 acyltransferase [Burkholderia thailandensis]PNE80124.1 acyltransferase [Burkholderia thailandensis]PNE86067.1 acyltransferase [Burkholderia thailandensis]